MSSIEIQENTPSIDRLPIPDSQSDAPNLRHLGTARVNSQGYDDGPQLESVVWGRSGGRVPRPEQTEDAEAELGSTALLASETNPSGGEGELPEKIVDHTPLYADRGRKILEVCEGSELPPDENNIPPLRAHALRELLGDMDFEDAKRLGVIERFCYYDENDWDAIVHILAGEVSANGFAKGFHHAPSAEYWPVSVTDKGEIAQTYTMDTGGRELLYPAEPYLAKAMIGNVPKKGLVLSPDGVKRLGVNHNSMFPVIDDGLSALRSIVTAYDNRDVARDTSRIVQWRGGEVERVTSWGKVPMIDGKSLMTVRVVTHDGKIFTARPVLEETTPMLLSENDMWKLLKRGDGFEGRNG